MPRALIVGGTGSIGRATARRLLAAGWQVDLTGRNPARLPADLAAAGEAMVQVGEVLEPNRTHRAVYDHLFGIYRDAYVALKPLFVPLGRAANLDS